MCSHGCVQFTLAGSASAILSKRLTRASLSQGNADVPAGIKHLSMDSDHGCPCSVQVRRSSCLLLHLHGSTPAIYLLCQSRVLSVHVTAAQYHPWLSIWHRSQKDAPAGVLHQHSSHYHCRTFRRQTGIASTSAWKLRFCQLVQLSLQSSQGPT